MSHRPRQRLLGQRAGRVVLRNSRLARRNVADGQKPLLVGNTNMDCEDRCQARCCQENKLATATLCELNDAFVASFGKREQAVWGQRMGLAYYDAASHVGAEEAFSVFVNNDEWVQRIQTELCRQHLPTPTRIGLEGWKRFFEASAFKSDDALRIQSDLVRLEAQIQARVAALTASQDSDLVGLMLRLRTAPAESDRALAHSGLRRLERCVLESGFAEMVRQRNRLARAFGYDDYYDYRTSTSEGIGKVGVFVLLDQLARGTRELSAKTIRELTAKHGPSAPLPHNYHFLAGSGIFTTLDPYYPVECALERWGKTFSGLAIRYDNAELTLDLLSRPGKYSNGFYRVIRPAYSCDDLLVPACIGLSCVGTPRSLGSGYALTVTLFHEAGHAAQFSNVRMPAPCFGQEFGPTSVASLETQGMFLDHLARDPDWRVRYAKQLNGTKMPRELIRAAVEARHRLRAMSLLEVLVVPYVEKAIYEMSDDEISTESILHAAREVENDILLMDVAPCPTLALPHLVASDGAAQHHAYILAEIAVQQLRHYFRRRDGYLLDNPTIGRDLAHHCWHPGNSRSLGAIEDLTGEQLSANALLDELRPELGDLLEETDRAVAAEREIPHAIESVELDARITLAHGDLLIASNENGAPFSHLIEKFVYHVRNGT